MMYAKIDVFLHRHTDCRNCERSVVLAIITGQHIHAYTVFCNVHLSVSFHISISFLMLTVVRSQGGQIEHTHLFGVALLMSRPRRLPKLWFMGRLLSAHHAMSTLRRVRGSRWKRLH
jgi:hypothetical protein